jgi:hypothetical protein
MMECFKLMLEHPIATVFVVGIFGWLICSLIETLQW